MAKNTFFSRRSIRSLLRGSLGYIFGKRGERRVYLWRIYYRLRAMAMVSPDESVQEMVRSIDAKLWVDEEAFPRIRKLLRGARHTIVIQMFIWKDDELGRSIASLLTTCADRGVRVYVIKEAVGDFFEFQGDFVSTKSESNEVWKRFWNHPNIRITHATNNDHSKVYIIDDKIMLLTGMNIADEYHRSWHDYLVELRGESFVQHYLTNGDIAGPSHPIRIVMNTKERKEIRGAVLEVIRGAQQSIVFEQCYLSDPQIVDEIIGLTKRGVDVTVVIPKKNDIHYNANMSAIGRIIAESDPRHLKAFLYPRVVHGKIILADKKTAFVGSANLITSSLDEMGEVNVLIKDGADRAVQKLRDVLREDILQSQPLLGPPPLWWFNRFLAWLNL